ncbi:Spermine synthase [Desulfobulbus propionicus DSM 2032]|uniref:Spermine synthase n=1 Tax=Desulfobulbus propionicus (strain ATCC 33891 / DSM 2032 / VKM B-1956 / 1pr3) TaxID=577650 RepID=A0A7U3YP79_DESPD|nr:fused MFS/spermidine synthase [Desulfobulbus propionicus]ADW18988.1 Spermine synthase [Desulfobulbus propionicus DSM 2032]
MLHCCIFLCGAALMIIELTGSRILAPFLGTSLVVWTSLIGIILASLSFGAWWGGVLADRSPRPNLLGRIVLMAAWSTAAIGLSKSWILEFLQGTGNLHAVAITATVALFAPAAILLGMVPPFAVRLCLHDTDHTGRTAGSLYALSTIGSIVGTFLAGFVLIAWVGSTAILFITAAFLVLASWLAEPSNKAIKGVSLFLFLLAIALCRLQDQRLEQLGFLDRDTPYNRVLVYTSKEEGTDRLMREMVTGPQGRQSAMYLDNPTELALPYTRFYRLIEHYHPTARRMLVLGGGGYSFPKYALARYPDLRIDVVELDPGITNLARTHFGLTDHPRLTIIEEDARTFLKKVDHPYDVILCDVFNSHYSIPFHLVTVEAIGLMHSALKADGVVLVNLLASTEGVSSRFYKALHATFRAAFPSVQAYAVVDPTDKHLWQNMLLVAGKGELSTNEPKDPSLRRMLTHALPPPDNHPPPFTDEYAPVDRYIGEFGLGLTAHSDS